MPLSGIEPRFLIRPACSLITTLTELSRHVDCKIDALNYNCSGEELDLELHAGSTTDTVDRLLFRSVFRPRGFPFLYNFVNYCSLSTVSDTEMRSRAFNCKHVTATFYILQQYVTMFIRHLLFEREVSLNFLSRGICIHLLLSRSFKSQRHAVIPRSNYVVGGSETDDLSRDRFPHKLNVCRFYKN